MLGVLVTDFTAEKVDVATQTSKELQVNIKDSKYVFDIDEEVKVIVNNKLYSGVVTKDITLEFVYIKGFDSPEDIPEEIINSDPTPVVPFDEPKTGDTSVPVLPIIFFTAIIFVAYKKRKRV